MVGLVKKDFAAHIVDNLYDGGTRKTTTDKIFFVLTKLIFRDGEDYWGRVGRRGGFFPPGGRGGRRGFFIPPGGCVACRNIDIQTFGYAYGDNNSVTGLNMNNTHIGGRGFSPPGGCVNCNNIGVRIQGHAIGDNNEITGLNMKNNCFSGASTVQTRRGII